MGIGALLFVAIRIYFMFTEVLESVTEVLNKINNASSPQKQEQFSPNTFFNKIVINEDTSPQEIEEIKKKFPMFADQIDKIINLGKESDLSNISNIKYLTLSELEKALQRAIDNNEFEKAAKIRDEIKSRK